MKSLKIPDNFIENFKVIAQLKKDEIEAINHILDNLKYGSNPKDLVNQIEEKLIGKGKIGFTIFSFGNLLLSEKQSQEEISQLLTDAFKRQNKDEATNFDLLKSNLIELFQHSQVLKTSYKTFELSSEYQKIFKDCRIISDMRFIFNDELNETPKNAVIVHQLKLEYFEDDDLKSSFIHLNNLDLIKLKTQIDRALTKESNIIKNFVDINFIELEN